MRTDFKHIDHELYLPELEQITNPNGKRVYVTPEGNSYPSVTTVLSAKPSEGLDRWRERVGEKEAKGILYQAGQRGSLFHDTIERYLKNEKDVLKKIDSLNRASILEMIPALDRIDDIYFLETMLYSDKLKVAGTADCIAYYDGELSIIDFKTSRSMKLKEWISSYFMQGAAYSYCFYERTNILVENVVIIMYVNHNDPKVFKVKVKDYIHDFVEMRKQYDEISNLQT